MIPARAPFPLLAALLLAPAGLAAQRGRGDEGPCTPQPGTGVVEGTVLDSTTAIPVHGAGVRVRWQPTGRASADRWEEESGETDAQGHFRVCDAPMGVPLSVRAGFWGERSQEQITTLGEGASARVALRVDGPHALVEGRVVDAGGQPVAGAEVRLARVVDPQITGPGGAFRFGRMPPGEYEIHVRHLAYTTVVDTLGVDMSTTLAATIRMAPEVIPIDPISVTVRSLVLERSGFYEREGRSSGHFFTRQQIESQRPLQSSELLRRVAGVRLQRGRDGIVAIARAGCPFRYVIDGVRTHPSYSIDLIPTGDIEGMEVYLGPSQVPGEFAAFSGDVGGTCGVIVVWTRRNLKI